MTSGTDTRAQRALGRVADAATPRIWKIAVIALVVGELLAISVIYTNTFAFTCRAVLPAALCSALSLAVVRAVLVLGVLGLFLAARPGCAAALGLTPAAAGQGSTARGAPPRLVLAVQIAGVLLILAPALFLSDSSGPSARSAALAAWGGGAILASLGTVFSVAPLFAWRRFAVTAGPAFPLACGVALVAPEAALLAQGYWTYSPITDMTFRSVRGLLEVLGYETVSELSSHMIGTGEFRVRVGRQCSGIEGFALITGFVAGYLALFRVDLRFPHALVLLPMGVLLSWCFNVLRIALLILIGHHGNPELAIGGFHSHAGWLMFSLLALGLILASRALAVLTAAPPSPARVLPPLLEDPYAAALIPFAVFMGAGLMLATLTATPAAYYPLKALVLALALSVFAAQYRRMAWRADLLTLVLGIGIGVIWVVAQRIDGAERTGPITELTETLTPALFWFWAASRVLGTVLLVPLTEELFFRGYLQSRLAGSAEHGTERMRRLRLVVAVLASAALFALLHERWLMALGAGLIYGGLVLRSGRLADAVIAHMASNAVIAGAAILLGDWDLI